MKLNAVPLRRVAQAFVIATQTKLDLTGVEVPEHIDDDYLKKPSKKSLKDKAKKNEPDIFAPKATEVSLSSSM